MIPGTGSTVGMEISFMVGDLMAMETDTWERGGHQDKNFELNASTGPRTATPRPTSTPDIRGAKGSKGDDGEVGPAGPKGATGAKGSAGAKGDDGAAGAAGPKGDTGAKGSTGAAGTSGSDGAAGAAGADGAAGEAGTKGDRGSAGAAGGGGGLGIIALILAIVAPTRSSRSLLRKPLQLTRISASSASAASAPAKAGALFFRPPRARIYRRGRKERGDYRVKWTRTKNSAPSAISAVNIAPLPSFSPRRESRALSTDKSAEATGTPSTRRASLPTPIPHALHPPHPHPVILAEAGIQSPSHATRAPSHSNEDRADADTGHALHSLIHVGRTTRALDSRCDENDGGLRAWRPPKPRPPSHAHPPPPTPPPSPPPPSPVILAEAGIQSPSHSTRAPRPPGRCRPAACPLLNPCWRITRALDSRCDENDEWGGANSAEATETPSTRTPVHPPTPIPPAPSPLPVILAEAGIQSPFPCAKSAGHSNRRPRRPHRPRVLHSPTMSDDNQGSGFPLRRE